MKLVKLFAALLLAMYLVVACSSDNHEHGGDSADEHAGEEAKKKEHAGEKAEHGGEAAEEQ